VLIAAALLALRRLSTLRATIVERDEQMTRAVTR